METNKIYTGDCLDVLKDFPDNSIDSIITDPPYGLSKDPDVAEIYSHWAKGEYVNPKSKGGFMGKSWDSFVPSPEIWKECFRVLKPGGIALVFAGTRTQDLMGTSLRFAGFSLKDCIMYMYGSGFPKSHNLSKSMKKSELTEEAKEWNGWGTALKPAYEPILVCMKPLEGTYAQNALEHGVAGFNIDGSRIETNEVITNHSRNSESAKSKGKYGDSREQETHQTEGQKLGRFPANFIHDGSDEVVEGFPDTGKSTGGRTIKRSGGGNVGSGKKSEKSWTNDDPGYGDSGKASRFFYCAKASKSDRGEGNNHPTVKPMKLMEYLCNLTKTPTGGIVLDPFLGSGTTAIACMHVGRDYIGIEREQEYVDIANKRIERDEYEKEKI